MKKNLISIGILASVLSSAQAGLIESDDFSYPDGGIVTNSTWVQNTGTAGTSLVSNQTLIVTTARSEDIAHFLTGQPYMTNGPTTNLYASFTFKCVGLPTTPGTYFAHFGGTNGFVPGISGHRCRVTPATTNAIAGTNDTSGNFYLYLQIGNDGISVTNQWPTPLSTNVTYTIVTKYALSNGFSTIWINPSAETDPSVTDTNFIPYDIGPSGVGTNGPINIIAYDFRQASGEGTMLVDNLRVGTRFADVAGANTAPAISSIEDQFIPRNSTTGPLDFTVQDNESPANDLHVTASSSNTGLVPNSPANLILTGSSTNRTITVTPASGQQGVTTITLTVSDTVNNSSTTFKVTVGAPTISPIPDQTAVTNTPVPPIPVTVVDAEGDTITFTSASSNPNVITTGNISVSGSGPNYTLTLTPTAGQIGVSFITIFASDGHSTNSTSFRLIMRPLLGLVFDEDFAYTNFDAGIPNGLERAVGGSGWAWSGEGWQHVSPSSNHFQLQVTNGWAYLVNTDDEDVGDGLTNAPYFGSNGVVFYTSFPVAFSSLPSPGGDYFFHLSSSDVDTSNFRGKIFSGRSGAAAGKLRLGIANQQNSPVFLPYDLDLNTTNTVVMRYNSANGESALWVNPNAEGSPHATANDSPGASTIGGVGLRQPGSAIGDLTIGHLKVGTAFSDVATVVPPPTPETLQAQIVGGQLVLSWTSSAFRLASSAVVTGPYVPILGSTSPYTNTLSGDATFFRLVYP